MRLLYIANIRLPTEKAHGVQVMKMCEAFAKLGHEVELVVPRRFNAIQNNPFEYYGVARSFPITRVFSLDTIALGRFGFWIQSLSFAFAACVFTLRRKPDVIYGRDEVTLALLSFFRSGIRWEVHTERQGFFVRRLLKTLACEKIITITAGFADIYRNEKFNSAKLIVAPDGVDLEEFASLPNKTQAQKTLGLPSERPIIAYIGKYKTMGEQKGVDEIIAAFAQLLDRKPQPVLLLVGLNADEFAEIEAAARKTGLNPDIMILVGHMPRLQALLYMRAADILVMNYPNTPHYARLMSPLKLFEYMASGNPIVSSDLPSIREILNEKNARLCEPDNIGALSRALQQLLSDTIFGSMLSRQALHDVAQYSWELRARKVITA